MPNPRQVQLLQNNLLGWYQAHGRQDLPWQHPRSAYRIWISEIMLQQTQVRTVLPYFEKFMQQFPDIRTLAAASLDEILNLWSGLGYYARARNLHLAAQQIVQDHRGELPSQQHKLRDLPGIGRSTAAAIVAQAWEQPAAILDGNVKRVLARLHCIPGAPNKRETEQVLWQLAEAYTPKKQVAAYTQAIMDLGATVCTWSQPRCSQCPLRSQCEAYAMNQTAQFPDKNHRNLRGHQFTSFLMVENLDQRIWLERRTGSGVWGGLFCFPEWDISQSINDWTLAQFGARVHKLEHWPRRVHRFTHFDLAYDPLRVILGPKTLELEPQAAGEWVQPQGSRVAGGLATPIKKLIEELSEAYDDPNGNVRQIKARTGRPGSTTVSG